MAESGWALRPVEWGSRKTDEIEMNGTRRLLTRSRPIGARAVSRPTCHRLRPLRGGGFECFTGRAGFALRGGAAEETVARADEHATTDEVAQTDQDQVRRE